MNSAKNPAQRVGVFVDVANMYHSAQKLFHTNVDFAQVLKTAVAGRQLVRAVAYAIKAETPEEEKFFNALVQQGYETRIKELQTFVGGHKKGDWDLGLAIDAIRMAPKLDAVVLVSGDGDYIPLVEHLKSLGARVEVIAFRESASGKLLEHADDFVNLSAEHGRFLKRGNARRRSNFTAAPAGTAPAKFAGKKAPVIADDFSFDEVPSEDAAPSEAPTSDEMQVGTFLPAPKNEAPRKGGNRKGLRGRFFSPRS